MAKARATRDRQFASFSSPEHDAWRKHRDLLGILPVREAGFRGHVGLAALLPAVDRIDAWPAPGGMLFAPDDDIRWVTLQDVPRGHWQAARGQDVRLASVYRTRIQYGMPGIGTRPPEAVYDFSRMPFDRFVRGGKEVTPGPEVLNHAKDPRLFRVLNALNVAMSSAAAELNRGWRAHRDAIRSALGIEGDSAYVFGGGPRPNLARPWDWMPRAYLGFADEVRDVLFGRATKALPRQDGQDEPHLPVGLVGEFVREFADRLPVVAPISGAIVDVRRRSSEKFSHAVLAIEGTDGAEVEVPVLSSFRCDYAPGEPFEAGSLLGHDIEGDGKSRLHKMPLGVAWDIVINRVGRARILGTLGVWFRRQMVDLVPGYVHAPAAIVSRAALGDAVDSTLHWELTRSLPYHEDTADALIFPVVRQRRWDDFQLDLAGEVRFDVSPPRGSYVVPRRRAGRS